MLMLDLHMGSFEMPLVHESFIVMRRPPVDPTWPAIECYARPLVDNHSTVVDVDVGNSDVVNGAVVIKRPAMPIAAFVAFAEITEAVIDPAVEADVRAPITGMPKVGAAAKRPIARSPEQARLRCNHPSTRHPVISIRSVSPVAGSPNISIARTRRLGINRQHRRRNVHGHENSCKR